MLTTTVSNFRNEMKSYFDKIINEKEKLILTRGKNSGIVIMSIEEYNNTLNATEYELSNSKNAQILEKAISEVEKGKIFKKELIEG